MQSHCIGSIVSNIIHICQLQDWVNGHVMLVLQN